jgi:diguanylate cyclase (GGDEF)-like protein/PAS domain S-box-containing protein
MDHGGLVLSDAFKFQALMENTEDSIYFKDRECRLLHVNRRMADSLGVADPSELVGKTDSELFGESFGQRTFIEDRRIMESDEPIIGLVESRRVGVSDTNWTLTTKVPLHDSAGVVVGLLGITRDINELKRTELDLQQLATHDALTGLPNRYLMTDRLSQTIAHCRRTGTSFAVLFLDIDDFKAVNDARGHEFGDLVLRAVSRTLVEIVRSSDTVARIGGDEFVIVLELGRREDVAQVAETIRRSVGKLFTPKRDGVKVSLSIGISIHPDDGVDAEVLLRAADYAMYLAKGEGKDRWLMCPPGTTGKAEAFDFARPDPIAVGTGPSSRSGRSRQRYAGGRAHRSPGE